MATRIFYLYGLLISSDVIAGELIGDSRFNGNCGIDIAIARGRIAAAPLGDAAAIKRRRVLRIEPERCIVSAIALLNLPLFKSTMPRLSKASA